MNSGEECGGEHCVARRKKREASGGKGVRVGFYRRARPCRGEGEREQSWAEPRTTGGAGVLCGAWQPLGNVGPTWRRGERPAGAARAVGGVGRRVEQDKGGADLQVLGGGRRQRSCAQQRAEEIGDSRKTMEDLGAISQKCRDPTVMI
jgi:hypothetical protein